MYKLHISNNAALLKTAKNNLDSSPKNFVTSVETVYKYNRGGHNENF